MAGDGLSASVDIGAGEPAEADALAHALARARVVFGIDAEACAVLVAALRDPEGQVEGLRVATGVPAVIGSDGYFSPAFEPGIQPGRVDADGKMDFRSRDLLKPVAPGTPIGVLHPAIPATPGMRVDGGIIAVAPAREATLALGRGVRRAPDGTVVAAVAGVILYVPAKQLDVVQHHRHRGDVDLRSGHLETAGSLSVSGDVQRLFRVRASGDVQIAGSVHGGSVQAGGSLSVKGAVRGGSEGELSAGGDLHVHSAERARVRSGGLLKLESAIHCTLEAKVIEVGVLRGGTAHAERFLVAEEIGFAERGETAIRAGVPIALVEAGVRAAVANARDERARVRPTRNESGRSTRGRPSLQRDDLERLVALRHKREELQRTAHVLVRATAHPGITIQLGDAQLTLEYAVVSARFSYDVVSRSIRIERYVP